jgi:hypothetical protein
LASRTDDYAYADDIYGDYEQEVRYRPRAGKRLQPGNPEKRARRREQRERERRRVDISKPFKCRQCRSFIGAPLTGGRQRNHCPNCLHSLHVDLKTPGDRGSDCKSLMEPVASFVRPGGEQVVVHRCKGCGIERHNRVAADDHPLLLMRLPLVEPRSGVGLKDEAGQQETA